MIYKKYGGVFKKLRIQHKLSLRDFERIGLSKSTISSFENGKTLISFDKLDLALQEMHTTFRSYMLMLNNDEEDYWLNQLKKIEYAYFNKNLYLLEHIYVENNVYDLEENKVIALSAKACYSHLSPLEVSYVETKLKSYYIWHSYELYILVNTLDEIDPILLQDIVWRILSQNKYYLKEITEFRNLLIRVVIRATLAMIRQSYKDYSERFLKALEELTIVFDTYIRISTLFVKGCWIYAFDNQITGKKLIARALKILSEIGALELREVFQKDFEKICNKSSA
ncbi:Rgg/GadR/MutR family transcriptional regulator [Lactococcus formosensis]|uniref:Rgg/GadR/MutR family transcriptional regulator n=1 Tax=Lactococcus formosensis TaxID=1281486 RepID=UPI0007CB9725|nr:Rgg/GadR/MutR family transcriptional regulator [Lactococcus formosensis]BAV02989.1 Helix-turn-helix domain protein [Lactococcus formosensis]BDW50035.1 transcriptional regulator [Lactococcus formosensis]BDX25624.1 transcriptional regulator [Lactococcus formosensis]